MNFDRFDVCEAYYLFFALHHEGQNSFGYKKLSQISKIGFSISPLRKFDTLSENGKEIFLCLWKKYSNLESLYDFLFEEIETQEKYDFYCDLAQEIFA